MIQQNKKQNEKYQLETYFTTRLSGKKACFPTLTSIANHFVAGTMTGARFYLGFFVGRERGLNHKNNFWSHAVARKNFFGPSKGFRGHASTENFGKIVFRIG